MKKYIDKNHSGYKTIINLRKKQQIKNILKQIDNIDLGLFSIYGKFPVDSRFRIS